MKKLTILVPLISAFIIAGNVYAKPQDTPMQEVFRQLDLTQQQRTEIRELMKQTRQQGKMLKQNMGQQGKQLNSIVHAAEFDQAAARELISQRQQKQSQAALSRAQNRHQIWKQLSDAQQQKFTQLMAEKAMQRQQDRQGQERNPMRMFNALNLEPEQESQIQQIMDQQKGKNQLLRQQLRSFRQAEAQIIHSDEFDQQAWQKLNEQQREIQIQLALSHSQVQNKVWNLLSVDQQQQLESMQQKRAKKWREKHAHKRDSM